MILLPFYRLYSLVQINALNVVPKSTFLPLKRSSWSASRVMRLLRPFLVTFWWRQTQIFSINWPKTPLKLNISWQHVQYLNCKSVQFKRIATTKRQKFWAWKKSWRRVTKPSAQRNETFELFNYNWRILNWRIVHWKRATMISQSNWKIETRSTPKWNTFWRKINNFNGFWIRKRNQCTIVTVPEILEKWQTNKKWSWGNHNMIKRKFHFSFINDKLSFISWFTYQYEWMDIRKTSSIHFTFVYYIIIVWILSVYSFVRLVSNIHKLCKIIGNCMHAQLKIQFNVDISCQNRWVIEK